MKTIASEPVEFEDKTVDRAIEAARRHFGLPEEHLEIKILTKGSTGIFGLGGRKARIKVVPKVIPTETLEAEVTDESQEVPVEVVSPTDVQEGLETIEVLPENSQQKTPESHVPSRKLADREDVIQKAREVAGELFQKAGLDAQVEIKMGQEGPYLDISGQDLSLVIGREGQTLNAIEYIINRITARKMEGSRGVIVDAQGYREKRSQSLASLAQRMASKARKIGKPVALNPMGARERRIVHVSLRNFPGVKTRSVGEGRERKVIISPLNTRYRGRKRERGPRT